MIKSEILRKHLEITSFFGFLRCEEFCPSRLIQAERQRIVFKACCTLNFLQQIRNQMNIRF